MWRAEPSPSPSPGLTLHGTGLDDTGISGAWAMGFKGEDHGGIGVGFFPGQLASFEQLKVPFLMLDRALKQQGSWDYGVNIGQSYKNC